MTERASQTSAINVVMRVDALDGPARRMTGAELDQRSETLVDLWLARGRAAGAPHRTRRVLWLAAAVLAVTGSAAAMWVQQRALLSAAMPPPATSRPHELRLPRPSVIPEPAALQPTAAEPRPAPPVATRDTQAMQDLLRRANRLRGTGRYRAAEQLYLRVLREAPNGASAQIAAVAAAALRLEHLRDVRGALALYRRARAAGPASPLALETEEGMARAYAQLGDRKHEREALERIVQRAGEGPIADRARARLQVLNTNE